MYLLTEHGGAVWSRGVIALVRDGRTTRIIEDGGERRSSFRPAAIAKRSERIWGELRSFGKDDEDGRHDTA